jgi:hypothetical protein
MKYVEFACTAQATIREHWRCLVPEDVIVQGDGAIREYLGDAQVSEPGWDLRVPDVSDEVVGNEHDRQIEADSIEVVS